jgi:hypothetical protein
MNNSVKAVSLIIVLMLSLQACDININTTDSSSVPPIVLTITAQAAILQQGQQPVNPSNASPATANVTPPVAASPNSPNPTSTNTPGPVSATATNTNTPGGPATVKVTAETNCRTGPGLIYASVYSMSVSDVAEVIGKNTATNYWIIKIPKGGGATCWLWGQYAIISGDTSILAEFATPTPNLTATAKLTPPAAPSNLTEQDTCTQNSQPSLQDITGTLSWTDNSNNETGYHIYSRATGMQGSVDILLATLGANTTSYNFTVQSLSKSAVALKVEAFNNAGPSGRKVINIAFQCP